jgi:hypothetical protein
MLAAFLNGHMCLAGHVWPTKRRVTMDLTATCWHMLIHVTLGWRWHHSHDYCVAACQLTCRYGYCIPTWALQHFTSQHCIGCFGTSTLHGRLACDTLVWWQHYFDAACLSGSALASQPSFLHGIMYCIRYMQHLNQSTRPHGCCIPIATAAFSFFHRLLVCPTCLCMGPNLQRGGLVLQFVGWQHHTAIAGEPPTARGQAVVGTQHQSTTAHADGHGRHQVDCGSWVVCIACTWAGCPMGHSGPAGPGRPWRRTTCMD